MAAPATGAMCASRWEPLALGSLHGEEELGVAVSFMIPFPFNCVATACYCLIRDCFRAIGRKIFRRWLVFFRHRVTSAMTLAAQPRRLVPRGQERAFTYAEENFDVFAHH